MTRKGNCDINALGRVSPAMLLFVLICYSQTLSYALLTSRIYSRRNTITTSSSTSSAAVRSRQCQSVTPLFATTIVGSSGGSKSALNENSYGDDEFDDDEDDDEDGFEYLDRRTGRPLGNNDQEW